jgi:hypothetical protein
VTSLVLGLGLGLGPASVPAAEPAQLREFEQQAADICLVPLGTDSPVQPALRLAALNRFRVATDRGPPRLVPMAPMWPSAIPGADNIEPALQPVADMIRLNFYGGRNVLAGRYEPAQAQFNECLNIATRVADLDAEATCANNLGVALGARGQYGAAQEMLQRALDRFQAQARTSRRGPGANDLDTYRALLEARSAPLGVERAQLNLGNLALALGRRELALGRFQSALGGHPATAAPACKTAAANDLARLYRQLGRDKEADELLRQYGNGRAKRGESGLTLYDAGSVALGVAAAAGSPPAPVPSRADREAMAGVNPDPLAVGSEVALKDLLAQADRDAAGGQAQRAAAGYSRAALRAAASQRPEIEAAARVSLMRLHAAAGRPATAILHGKRAANLLQGLRGAQADAGQPRALRKGYLRDRQQTYTRLAQLLLDAKRLEEAESVLRMLKEDEGQQFQAGGGPSAYAMLPETPREQAAWRQFQLAVDEVRKRDAERSAEAAGVLGSVTSSLTVEAIEKRRLEVGTGLIQFLEATGRGERSALEAEVARLPLELRQTFFELVGSPGQRVRTALSHLAEDAPQFRATVATPQQLTHIRQALARQAEIQAALAGLLARTRREPALTMAQAVERNSQQNPVAQLAQRPEAMRAMSQAVMQQAPFMQQLQRAQGLATMVFMGAVTGTPMGGDIGAVEGALRGLPPELLDGFAEFVRAQGQQMSGMQAPYAGDPSKPDPLALIAAAQALGAQGRTRGRAADPRALADALRAATGQRAAASAAVGGAAARVKSVQAQLEAAAERARPTAGQPLDQRLERALAESPALKDLSGSSSPQVTIGLVEPLERYWRAQHALALAEARQQQAEADWAVLWDGR